MTKTELIKKIAFQGKVSVSEATAFYDILEKVLFEALTSEAEVILSPSLGKFVLKTISAQKRPEMTFQMNQKTGIRTAIKTGRILQYPAATVVRFKVSQTLKTAVKTIQLQ